MDKRKEHVDLAKLAEQAERYEDMVQEMKSVVINAEGDLTDEERNLLSVAYKNVVGARRSAWRIIQSLEKKAVDEEKANLAREYRETVETELKDQCNEVLVLIDEHLLEKTSEEKVEARVFYLKMKGDYYRYLVEIEPDRQDTVAKSKQAYTDARELASEKLLKTHPISLGLALNFSVFYYEIEGKPDKACKVAKEAFDDAIAQLDNINEDSYKDSTLIMQLLRDNLTLWEAQDREDEQAAD